MSASIHINVFIALQHGQHGTLHILTFNIFLISISIYGVMTYNNNPVFMRIAQSGIEPLQLRVVLLLASIGVNIRHTVTLNKRGSIDKHYAHGEAFLIKHLCIIASRHHPSAAHLTIVEHGLRVTTIFVVAQHRKPVDHQFWMRIHPFIISVPQGVVHRGNAIKMMNVASGQHTLRFQCFSHITHQFGYRFLVIISVAS